MSPIIALDLFSVPKKKQSQASQNVSNKIFGFSQRKKHLIELEAKKRLKWKINISVGYFGIAHKSTHLLQNLLSH